MKSKFTRFGILVIIGFAWVVFVLGIVGILYNNARAHRIKIEMQQTELLMNQ